MCCIIASWLKMIIDLLDAWHFNSSLSIFNSLSFPHFLTHRFITKFKYHENNLRLIAGCLFIS